MIEPIAATTTAPADELIPELALHGTNNTTARTEDTVRLSQIAQAAIRADELRAEEIKAATQKDIERAATTSKAIEAEQLRATEVHATEAADQARNSDAAATG